MKRLLVVVDYQKDFVSGSLGFEGAVRLGPVICEKIRRFKAAGDPVVFTMDTHFADYLTTQEGRNLPVLHCERGSEGWALVECVAGLSEGCRIFEKNTFGSLDFANYLLTESFDEIELCGVVSNICVLCNAILAKTALPEANIKLDARAVASFDPVLEQKAFDVMEGIQILVRGRGPNES